jgi:hypothetical protein
MVHDLGIAPLVAVWDTEDRENGRLLRSDFQEHEATNEHRWPNTLFRMIARRRFEPAREGGRAIARRDGSRPSRNDRGRLSRGCLSTASAS